MHRKMFQVEHIHKKRIDFNDRKRVERKHHLTAVRNDLENARMVLDEGVRRMPEGVRKYYWDRIDELDSEIKVLKPTYLSFTGSYASNKNSILNKCAAYF